MWLSKVDIDLLVDQVTDIYIKNSSYLMLRNSCIHLLSVSFVIDEVKKHLTRILKGDQQESASLITLDACKKQLQLDLDEEKHDAQEAQTDLLLSIQLNSKLNQINEQIRMSEAELQQDKENIQHLQLRMRRIEALILDIHKKEEATHHHHSTQETDDPLSKTAHTHAHSEATDQPEKTTHTHPEASVQHSKTTHTHSDTTHHGHPETDIEIQKNMLTKQLSELQNNLQYKQFSHKKLLEQRNEIRQKIDLELPERAKQRQVRTLARENRAKARSTDDPTLLQLSPVNRNAVKKAIETEDKKLRQKEQQLIQRADERSYQSYLIQLEIYLQSTTHLTYLENEALKQIIQLMREYLLIKEDEQKTTLKRQAAHLEKEKLVADKHQKEKKIEQYKESNPLLASQNSSLAKENEQLEIAIEDRRNYKNTLLKIGLLFFLLTAGGAGTGLAIAGGIIAITPLLLAPAAVLAFITLNLFVAALVYTIKNGMDSNQLSKNQITIKNNLTTIAQHNSELISLESEILPNLLSKIREAEHNLSVLDKHIEGLQQHAELKLNTAKQVTVRYPSAQPSVLEQTQQSTYQDSSKPSAPFMDDSTERNAFTYN